MCFGRGDRGGISVRQHTAALQSILSDFSISHSRAYCIISILFFHYEVKNRKKKKYEFVAAEHRALADFGIRESEVFSVSCGFSSVAILSWNKRSLRDAAGCCFVQPLFI